MQDIYLQLIDYAEYNTLQQIQLSHCADLIIGTQGAGLMWYACNAFTHLRGHPGVQKHCRAT